jgi:hypothetical protein
MAPPYFPLLQFVKLLEVILKNVPLRNDIAPPFSVPLHPLKLLFVIFIEFVIFPNTNAPPIFPVLMFVNVLFEIENSSPANIAPTPPSVTVLLTVIFVTITEINVKIELLDPFNKNNPPPEILSETYIIQFKI